MKIDIHVHTTASSCSIFSPHELVQLAGIEKASVIVTTNHHNSCDDVTLLEYELGIRSIKYFPAIEISNNWGDFLLFGENLSDFQEPRNFFPAHLLPRDDIAVVWAHPFRFMHEDEVNFIKWEVAKYIDAVEIINGNCLRKCPWANVLASRLAGEIGKPGTAGSDAHSAKMFFMAWTEFEEPVNSYGDLVRQIKEGRVRPGG